MNSKKVQHKKKKTLFVNFKNINISDTHRLLPNPTEKAS